MGQGVWQKVRAQCCARFGWLDLYAYSCARILYVCSMHSPCMSWCVSVVTACFIEMGRWVGHGLFYGTLYLHHVYNCMYIISTKKFLLQ